MWMTEEITDTRRLLGASREDSQLACRLIAEAKRKLFESSFVDADAEGAGAGAADRPLRTAPPGAVITMSEPYQIRDWCKSLGCSKHELEVAVARVGPSVARVREFLQAR
jgi:hypothetical protein